MPRGIYNHYKIKGENNPSKRKDVREKISLKLSGRIISDKTKKILSKIQKGLHRNPETEFKKGQKHTQNWKDKMSEIQKKRCKEGKHNWWKGGITELEYNIRHSLQYRKWRDLIFIRDNYICQDCKQIKNRLNAHHKKSFAKILQENNIKNFDEAINCQDLWNINNGITLCEECHKKTDNYLLKARWK
jgi:hypothetical protein